LSSPSATPDRVVITAAPVLPARDTGATLLTLLTLLAMTDAGWRDVEGEVRSVTLTVAGTCDHCAQPVPINGPVEIAHCPNCTKDTPIPHLYEAIA
jgi:hypothetical protein